MKHWLLAALALFAGSEAIAQSIVAPTGRTVVASVGQQTAIALGRGSAAHNRLASATPAGPTRIVAAVGSMTTIATHGRTASTTIGGVR